MSDELGTEKSRCVLLRRRDQLVIAVFTFAALAAMAGHWWAAGGASGDLIEIEDQPPPEGAVEIAFHVDVNRAAWPELAQLPGIGEVLARRIVALRERQGSFRSYEDLRQVRGIGVKKLAAMIPYLRPISREDEASKGQENIDD